VPVPESATECAPVALEATSRLAVRAPATVGVNFTCAVHEAPAATLEPAAQVPPPTAKSAALVPLSDRPEIIKAAVPELVTVTVCAALDMFNFCAPKARLMGEKLKAGVPVGGVVVPVPLKATAPGLPAALCAIDKLPLAAPAAVGLKVTVILQLAPAATAVLAQPVAV
jgi:hypothetical protein